MWVVILEVEIFVFEIEDIFHLGVYFHSGEVSGFARELFVYLVEVICIDMGIAQSVDEISRLQPAHLRHHHTEKGIACDVEGHTEEAVGAALVKLQRQLPFRHIKLKEGVTRRKIHILKVSHVPCTDYDAVCCV